MPESPSSSFIPKRGVGKKPATARKSNFVLLSIISYALFVSAPLASAAVFIYQRHTENQFNKAVVNLDRAIESFKEEDLKRVTDFSERLTLSKKLLASHVSIVKLLQTIEVSTAQTVRFKSMDITRLDASTLAVNSLLSTSKFDGALFQRSSYDAVDIINNPLFSEVSQVREKETTTTGASSDSEKRTVEFKVAFNFAAADIQYKSLSEQQTIMPEVIETTVLPESTDSTDVTGSTTSNVTSDETDI